MTDYRTNGLYPRYLAALTFDSHWQLEDRGPVVGRLEEYLRIHSPARPIPGERIIEY